MEGLSNKMQAVLVGVSSGLIAFGTAAFAVPNYIPAEIKVPISVAAWLAGVIDFSLKEALGGPSPKTEPKSE
jgi:hypothetical protein